METNRDYRCSDTCKIYGKVTNERHDNGVGRSRKLIERPVKDNKIENKKKGENIMNRFILTEDQQRYFESELRSVGPSLANAIVRINAYD